MTPEQVLKIKWLADDYATAAYNEGSAMFAARSLAALATTKARNALHDAIDALTTEEDSDDSLPTTRTRSKRDKRDKPAVYCAACRSRL